VFGRVHCAGHRRFGERRRASGKAYVDDHPTLHYEAGDGVVGDVVVRTIDAGYEMCSMAMLPGIGNGLDDPIAAIFPGCPTARDPCGLTILLGPYEADEPARRAAAHEKSQAGSPVVWTIFVSTRHG
jgi:hypothetical protein